MHAPLLASILLPLAGAPEAPPPTLWREPLEQLAREGRLEGLRLTAEGSLDVDPGRAWGELTTAEHAIPPADRAVASWNVRGGDGARLTVSLRAKVESGWTPWAVLGRWDGREGTASLKHQDCDLFLVETDTLVLRGKPAAALQLRARLSSGRATEAGGAAKAGAEARLTSLAVTHWLKGQRAPLECHRSAAWGRVLEVPERSQMIEPPAVRGRICSPTSLSMVLAYHGVDLPTSRVSAGVLDREEGIWGNWPANTEFAGTVDPNKVREAFVRKMNGLEEAEAEIAAGRPLVLSHRFGKGDLAGAPISESDGHLIVLVGFSAGGDPVVNDPAADPARGQSVRRTYRRAELYHTWLELADGISYVVIPVTGGR
jgi:peptidase C39-like protein